MKKLLVLLVVIIAISGCTTIQAGPPENVAPLPPQVQEFITNMTEEYGEPLIHDQYPIVIMRWLLFDTYGCLFLGYDAQTEVWVYATYEVPRILIDSGGGV